MQLRRCREDLRFGPASLGEEDLLAAFELNRRRIEQAASNLLNEIGAKPMLLHSGYFRFCD
ncbi:hypothetical protein CUJ87_24430 [Paraburkholderia caledonica]|nr:hypothetical protein CUJ87_24430 [Paraburkholderia caledonica]